MNNNKQTSIFDLLKPYTGWLVLMIICSLISNGLNLYLPKLIAKTIDQFTNSAYQIETILFELTLAAVLIFVFTYLQTILQTYISELAAKNLRNQLSKKISRQSFSYIENITPAKLLTNLTADIDSVKMFVAQGIVSIVSAVFTILGASILLITIEWKLALAVLTVIPIIGLTFFLIFSRVRALFLKSREIIDRLNKTINENIIGSMLVRVLYANQIECQKFLATNTEAKNIGMQILMLFATMIPIISFVANSSLLIILILGGHFVINGQMTIGDFTAFNSYISMLIFPILIIGFMSTIMAQATASWQRITEVLNQPEKKETGTNKSVLRGQVEFEDVSMQYGQKMALKHVSLNFSPGTKNAIIGPTAAGKTQLLYLLTGLIEPTGGEIKYDGKKISEYDQVSLHSQIGFVFQDSIIFNLSLRENIAFNNQATEEMIQKAIITSELEDFVNALPNKLDSMTAERGTSLSGGQKQRIMLARALAINPKILLLDDFTARIDVQTEKKILQNLIKNYPDLTLISVTQKISSVENFDQIILLMEGDVLATGTHQELLNRSPEYRQIYNSQRSTNQYELQSQ
ncbi:MAG TPA: ABC transporter ATP-binding protein [bacterium]|nr:ABC transporter ATP-binding protein [bacterium]